MTGATGWSPESPLPPRPVNAPAHAGTMPRTLKEKGSLRAERPVPGTKMIKISSIPVSRNTADSTTFSRFTGILVDDKSVDPSSYAADPGSLNVSLRPDFLETLSVGEHTITAVFDDGRADAGFTIVKKTSGSSSSTKKRSSGSSSGTRSSSGNSGSGGKKGPMTGDTAPVAMWAAIAAAAVAGIGILVFLRRKTKHV